MHNDPEQHIREICDDYRRSSDRTRDSLAGAIDRLQKAFSRRGHFIMEFIQNADDAKANQLVVYVSNDKVQVFNNGQPFEPKDVESICKVGRSSKTVEDYIGYLGVGFKSVFLISENPQIYSTTYRFKFNKYHWAKPETLPWQIMPIWIKEPFDEKWNTTFVIPLKNPEIADLIRNEISPDSLNVRMMLFLKGLKEIIIKDGKNHERKIMKKTTKESENYGICEIEEKSGESLTMERWVTFRKLCDVPSEVSEDFITKEWERDEVRSREVVVAFKLNEKNELEEVEGTAHIGVFSFLPLKEEREIGLKFLLQADFLTAPGREVITRETKWNQWLAKEIYNLIIEKCIPQFLKDDRWKMNFTNVLYPGEGGHLLFDDHIKRPLIDYLTNNSILIAEDGSAVTASEAILIGREVRELLSDNDLQILCPDKKPLHYECKPGVDIEKGPETVLEFVKNLGAQEIMNQKAKKEEVGWFNKLYSKINEYSNDQPVSVKDGLVLQNIILTDKNEVMPPNEMYMKSREISVPPEIESNFKIVHSDLVEDRKVRDFLISLGVKELTNGHIQSILKIKEIPEISKNWEGSLEINRIRWISILKELWQSKSIENNDIRFITLKTKSEKWLTPTNLFFPKEYQPEYNLEQIIEKGLLDLPVEFLSAEFIEGKDEKEMKDWYTFFEQMGVGEKLVTETKEGKSIVNRIGIKLALHFEETKGREAVELGESKNQLGYDIESKSGSEGRHIEVKARTDYEPDIGLTANQINTVATEGDRYYLYIVVSALSNPHLYVIKGPKLKNVFDFLSIKFSKWKKLKEEVFWP